MISTVALVVLNWNNAEDTLRCLASLEHLTYPDYEIVVVDNGSSDDSAPQIRAAYPAVTLIETGANLGYAGGNNVGIRYTLEHGAQFVCILNNDIIVEPMFLEPLLATLQNDPAIGVVTPLIAVLNAPESIWALGSSINRRTATVTRLHVGDKVSTWRDGSPFVVDVASGSAMLVKREVLETVGLMDEDFFLYYEETDWCLRVQEAGYPIVAVPSAIVLHKVSATLGETSPVIDYYMLRNHLRFVNRHWTGLTCRRIQIQIILRNLATIAAYTIKPHDGKRIPNRNARLMALRDVFLGQWGRCSGSLEERVR
jgi:hypothetical protein